MKHPLLYSCIFKGVWFRLDFPGWKILYFIHVYSTEYDFVWIFRDEKSSTLFTSFQRSMISFGFFGIKNPLLYSLLFKGVGFRLDSLRWKILYFIHVYSKEYDFVWSFRDEKSSTLFMYFRTSMISFGFSEIKNPVLYSFFSKILWFCSDFARS